MIPTPRIALVVVALSLPLAVPPSMTQEDPGPRPAPRPTHGIPAPAVAPVPSIECPDCGDGNPCTVDTCDTTTGLCRHEELSCDDGDPCTADFCERWDPPFACVHRPRLAGSVCSAAGPCTQAGVCIDGACSAAPNPEGTPCDAPSDCHEGDLCDGAGQCQPGRPLSPGTPCDDGDACSSDEVCGFDDVGTAICRGVSRACDDGNPCTIDACGVGDECTHTPVSCDDCNTCTADACDSATGTCTHVPASEGQGCPGPDRCTASSCSAGNCVATGAPGQICGDRGCERGVCNPYSPFLCSYEPDNSRCGPVDTCEFFYCDSITHQCRGGGACHPDQCTIGECGSRGFCIPLSGTPGATCNDGNACTTNDVCDIGSPGCSGTPVSCDDGNPCTVDSCDPSTGGCRNIPDPAACDDRNPCTADVCAEDGSTCLNAPTDGIACDDGDACTTGTTCAAGVCTGSARSCDDGNVCTTDSCDPASGCVNALVTCPGDGNDCTRETCDTSRGCVTIPLNGMQCGVGENECVTGACVDGACILRDSCDDGNPCTMDLCNGFGKPCSHAIDLDLECSDGNPCTVDDACAQDPGGTAACRGTAVSRIETCGVGACTRTVDTCAGGLPSACVAGAPQAETCNGVDDDCDGRVDENRIMANCWMKPIILFDPSAQTTLAFTCRFRDRCNANADLPPTGVDPAAVYVTRADRLADPDDNVVAPNPLSLACPDPFAGTAFERGVVETTGARVLGGSTVTFNFTTPADQDCATLDGDRTGLLERLATTPEGLVSVCVAGEYGGSPWEGCAVGLLYHRAGSAD